MIFRRISVFLFVCLLITSCASLPNSPSVMVLPGTGMSFDQFRNDDALCRQYAYLQVGGVNAPQFPSNNTITGAAVGTAVGGVTGAAIREGSDAAIGSSSGFVAGGLIGANSVDYGSYYADQQRYDYAFLQCMYANGHQVPVSGQFSGAVLPQSYPTQTGAAPTFGSIPPPPPGTPPPPPSR